MTLSDIKATLPWTLLRISGWMEKPDGGYLTVRGAPRLGRWSLPNEYINARPQATMMRVSARTAMPTARRYRTATRQRRFRRRRRGIKRMYRGRGTTPWSIKRVLSTSGFQSIDAGAGALAETQLFLNSAHDPLGSLSATQSPLGFTEYATLYNRYCVIGWSVFFEVCSLDNTNPVVVGFCPSLTAGASYHHYAELPGDVHRVCTPDQDKVVFGARGGVRRWVLPQGGKLLSCEEACSTVTGNPSRVLYGRLYLQAQDSAADEAAVKVTIKMKQLVVFFDPKTPSRSTQ